MAVLKEVIHLLLGAEVLNLFKYSFNSNAVYNMPLQVPLQDCYFVA